MATGREGLVARVSGVRMRNVTTTVHESDATFCFHENLRKNTMPRRRPNTSICGRVRHPASRASQAPVGRFFSANSTAERTKKRLKTWVWPQTDMLNHTAGLNKKRPAAVRLHFWLRPI